MKKIFTIEYKCEAIKDTAACGKDSDCKTVGTKCAGDTDKHTMECLTSGAGAGTVAKGCAKMVDLMVDCGAKTKDTCTGNCEWKGDDNFCEGAGSATMSLMTSDADGQALMVRGAPLFVDGVRRAPAHPSSPRTRTRTRTVTHPRARTHHAPSCPAAATACSSGKHHDHRARARRQRRPSLGKARAPDCKQRC